MGTPESRPRCLLQRGQGNLKKYMVRFWNGEVPKGELLESTSYYIA